LQVAGFAAAASALIVLAVAGFILNRAPVYQTIRGQQQTARLSDGSSVALNSDTLLRIRFTPAERRVELDRGEALFQVAKNPQRPFIVQVGDQQVRAVGTKFDVRVENGSLAVVLIEGRVAIARAKSGHATPLATLAPGERLILEPGATTAKVDRVNVETATAWRRGELMFEDAALSDAAAELNRYGGVPVALGDPGLAKLRVSGVFEARDPDEFAAAVAELHHLRVERTNDALVLRQRD
jgi:transmembrane sensor